MIGFKIFRVRVCFPWKFRVRVQSGLSYTNLMGSGIKVSGLRVFGFEKLTKIITVLVKLLKDFILCNLISSFGVMGVVK